MNILHTADWHIGKILHKHSLEEEHHLFFDWLFQIIIDQQIDLLLVSGDIFDIANPAAKDRRLYYHFLSRLIPLKIKIIITGGNHDSIGVINAPSDVLNALDIHVIGGATADIEDELIEIRDQSGEICLIVAAVPFLRDKDLRQNDGMHQQSSRVEALRAGIKSHYDQLAELATSKYEHIPMIGMGHLYAKGVISSESEREIHIGNAAVVEAGMFSSAYNYMALGHIHRPQIINKNSFIRYSGSPIALSFSERQDQKTVLTLKLVEGQLQTPESLPIPKYRDLRKISGSLQEVRDALHKYTNERALPAFIELAISEEKYSAQTLLQVENLITEYKNHDQFKILKSKTQFESESKTTNELFQQGDKIEDLKPIEVFLKKIIAEDIPEEQQEFLLEAFQELIDIVHEKERS